MIMFWNQKEVFIGCSLQKFNEASRILSANQIKYKHKLVNNNNTYLSASRRARTGTYGENMDYAVTYYIYVHQDDYESACFLLRNSQ